MNAITVAFDADHDLVAHHADAVAVGINEDDDGRPFGLLAMRAGGRAFYIPFTAATLRAAAATMLATADLVDGGKGKQ